jgi:hypothetical protein
MTVNLRHRRSPEEFMVRLARSTTVGAFMNAVQKNDGVEKCVLLGSSVLDPGLEIGALAIGHVFEIACRP